MKLKLVINGADVISEVRSLAKSYPNYIYGSEYSTCRYLNKEKMCGACIVGQALMRLGATGEDLFWLDRKLADIAYDGSIYSLYNLSISSESKEIPFDIRLSEVQAHWLAVVQDSQDLDFCWEKSVDWADTKWGELLESA